MSDLRVYVKKRLQLVMQLKDKAVNILALANSTDPAAIWMVYKEIIGLKTLVKMLEENEARKPGQKDPKIRSILQFIDNLENSRYRPTVDNNRLFARWIQLIISETLKKHSDMEALLSGTVSLVPLNSTRIVAVRLDEPEIFIDKDGEDIVIQVKERRSNTIAIISYELEFRLIKTDNGSSTKLTANEETEINGFKFAITFKRTRNQKIGRGIKIKKNLNKLEAVSRCPNCGKRNYEVEDKCRLCGRQLGNEKFLVKDNIDDDIEIRIVFHAELRNIMNVQNIFIRIGLLRANLSLDEILKSNFFPNSVSDLQKKFSRLIVTMLKLILSKYPRIITARPFKIIVTIIYQENGRGFAYYFRGDSNENKCFIQFNFIECVHHLLVGSGRYQLYTTLKHELGHHMHYVASPEHEFENNFQLLE